MHDRIDNMAKTSALAKRNNSPAPRVEILKESKGKVFPAGRMLISSPLEITQLIRSLAPGETLTVSELRQRLALRHSADYACPLTTGIFLRIAAEAADEESKHPAAAITPWWRVVKDNGRMLERMPGGPDFQAHKLTQEGHLLVQRRGVTYLNRNP